MYFLMTDYALPGTRLYGTNMSDGAHNKEPPYAEPHVRWCERSVNAKIGDKCLLVTFTSYSIVFVLTVDGARLSIYIGMNAVETVSLGMECGLLTAL